MNNEKIIYYFNNDPRVIRIKELENYIDNNEIIQNKYKELLNLQKKLINSKEFKQIRQYKIYQNMYKNMKDEFLDLPFVEEYIELINECYDEIKDFRDQVEEKIKLDMEF